MRGVSAASSARDFIELGTAQRLTEARVIAHAAGIHWLFDAAVDDVERVRRGIAAAPAFRFRPGVARAIDRNLPAFFYHLAAASEFGFREGLRYLAGIVNARRFHDASGRLDITEARDWLRRLPSSIGLR